MALLDEIIELASSEHGSVSTWMKALGTTAGGLAPKIGVVTNSW